MTTTGTREARLDTLDELYLHFGTEAEPWSVHLEVRVAGSLDAGRVKAAVRAAMRTHPLARARLAPWKPTDVHYHWLVPEHTDADPVTAIECADDAAVAAVRSTLQSHAPDLSTDAPFEVVVAHAPGGDYLMLNLHHGAGDGLSAFRLMNSIIREYAGEPDPVPTLDPLVARKVRSLIGAKSLMDRLSRARSLAEHLLTSVKEPARVAPVRGTDAGGYSFSLLHLDPATSKAVMAKRPEGATVNDLLLGGLAVTINRWNREHGHPNGRVALMMPVNLRPAEWQYEVLGNFASYVTVQIDEQAQTDLVTAARAAAQETAKIKTNRTQGLIVDLLELPNALPAGLKRHLPAKKPVVGERIVDTAVLSNLGRMPAAPSLGGDAGSVTELWFSPPGHMPLGTCVGAVSVAGSMFLTVRYRHAQFDSAAAAAFADLYKQVLAG
ncbi:MAG: condensation domain-containing protein [Nocardiaceae bacterium]|nr:condensation domain-containing protein [Nocardiaceae bacterium]